MKNIGMVVAVELDATLDLLGDPLEEMKTPAYHVRRYRVDEKQLYVTRSGAGEIAAAAATQFLITKFDVELIVNFGVVGGLTSKLSAAQACVVTGVVHYDFDVSAVNHCPVGKYSEQHETVIPTTPRFVELAQKEEPSLMGVICASGDKFIATEAGKCRLHEHFNADICEMEAAGIILTCHRNETPCLMVKTVADSVGGGTEEFHQEFERAARRCFEVLIKTVARIEE